MRVIAKKTLTEYGKREPKALASLLSWYHEAKAAEWKMPTDIKNKYRNASILKRGRVVFNIAGNKYRLVTCVDYESGIVLIRFIGTHAKYDRINAEEI